MDRFEFKSGVDAMVAALHHYAEPDAEGYSAYISFTGKGPRGGYVYGPGVLNRAAMIGLSAMIDQALGWPARCTGCGREEGECSADPCPDVIADREERKQADNGQV